MSVVLRPADEQDWADLYAWRNDATTRAMSVETDVVPLDEHLKWLKATLGKQTVHVYVARDPMQGPPVGTGRLEKRAGRDTEVELSLTVAPEWRGHGYGGQLITALVQRARIDFPRSKTVWATVRTTNFTSLRAFAHAGFTVRRVAGEFVELSRDHQ